MTDAPLASHKLRLPPSLNRNSNSQYVLGFELNRVNDPSAGSPTETLLRLLLPLSDKVH